MNFNLKGVYRSLLDQRSAADDLLHALDMHNQRREHLKSEIHRYVTEPIQCLMHLIQRMATA